MCMTQARSNHPDFVLVGSGAAFTEFGRSRAAGCHSGAGTHQLVHPLHMHLSEQCGAAAAVLERWSRVILFGSDWVTLGWAFSARSEGRLDSTTVDSKFKLGQI